MTSALLFSLFLGLTFCPYILTVATSDGSNGGSCLPDSNCTDINAVCDDSKICSCKPGYVNVAGLCRKTDGVLGGSCEFKADCLDGNSICFQLKCQCGVGFTPDGDICAPLEGATDPPFVQSTTFTPTTASSPPTTQPPTETPPSTEKTTLPQTETHPPTESPSTTENTTRPPTEIPPPTELSPTTGSTTSPSSETPQSTQSPSPTESTTRPSTETAPPTKSPSPAETTTRPPTETPPPTESPSPTESTTRPPTETPSSTETPLTESTVRPPTETTPPVETTFPTESTENTTAVKDITTPTYPVCTIDCDNGGTCEISPTGTPKCLCPQEFTGLNCEILVNVCADNPCPKDATCHADSKSPTGFVCICSGDFKGPNCTEEDKVVTCSDFERLLYLDKEPVEEANRTICVPKMNTALDDICFDESEQLIYKSGMLDDTRLRVNDFLQDRYCLVYTSDDAAEPKYCTNLTAYEADDVLIRPWRNASATVCFLFNRRPNLTAPFEVRYNIPNMAESETMQLRAVDPDDHQAITFEILGVEPNTFVDLFSVDSTGLLTTKKPSLQLPDPFEVDIRLNIQDDGIPVLKVERIFKVKFSNRQLYCSAPENPVYVHTGITSLPVIIGKINCQTNATSLTFSIPGDSDLANSFSVRPSGALSLTENLQSGTYQLTVKAEISDPIRVVADVNITIIIDNMIPACSIVADVLTLREDAIVGTCSDIIYTCSNPSGKPIECLDDSDIFDVRCVRHDDNTFDIKFCSGASLRNDVGAQKINTTISNIYGDTTLVQEGIVVNINDRPEIVKDVYNFTIEETRPAGYLVTVITVTDPDQFVNIDPPEELVVEITAPPGEATNQPSYPFEASLIPTQKGIEIKVSQSLDATVSRLYRFNIKVTDSGGLTDSVLITVHVEDVNEKPSCEQQQYNDVTVSVKDRPDKMIVTLQCNDRDIKPEYNTLSYKIEGSQIITEHFTVDSNGVIRLIKALTGVREAELNFEVIVSDGAGANVQVKINIDVSSDFPPQCGEAVITTRKSENTAENVCFTIPSQCIDPVSLQPLRYEIESGNGTQHFTLDTQQPPGDMIGLCTKNSLKNRYGIWAINGKVVSDFGRTPLTIHVSVSDTNDPPVFTISSYRVNVPENIPIGSTVIQLRARDPDSGAFGEVEYISEGNAGLESSSMFHLDRNSGWISVKGSLNADNTLSTDYNFTVKAIDGGPAHDPPVTTEVIISIIDVNDNAPVCDQPESFIELNLLTKPNSIVYSLNCTDADKSEKFRQLSYDIIRQSASDVFAVGIDGVVTLERILLRNVTSYTVEFIVYDSDDTQQSNTYTMKIIFIINTKVPPKCTPSTILETLPETKPVNFCIKQVRCVDETGGDEIILSSSTGDGMDYLEIKNRREGNELLLSACIKTSIKDKFGTYQIEGMVSNGLAEASVLWNFTVVNVNEHPRFSLALFEKTILEDAEPGPILKLELSDPDDSTEDKNFQIKNVSAILLNDEEFGGALNTSISFFSEVRMFYLSVRNLNATERNEYRYTVTAEDGLGLKATATAAIYIADVNESPICTASQVSIATNILAGVGEQIGSIDCYDTDIDTRNIELLYSITSGDPDGYFGVTDGLITVEKKLPRFSLYNIGEANLVITVEDRGVPTMSTTVSVQITVDNSIPPKCNPVIIPPSQWIVGSCLTVEMDCIDPTLTLSDSTSSLVYDLTGNFTTEFNKTDGIVGKFLLCYTRTTDGTFQIEVRVENGLSAFIFSEVVVVKYAEATPVFIKSNFKQNVSEFAAENEEVLRVNATSFNLIGRLIYTVVDAESDTGWSLYFSMDAHSGAITTKKELRELANKIMRLKVEVEDTGSQLKSSAQVEITIEDINEAPVCNIQPANIDIDVDAEVGHVIKKFQCSDADVAAEYKQLSYVLKGQANIQVYFKLIPEKEPTSIVLQEPLSVYVQSYDSQINRSRASYQIQLEVSDNGQPALKFTVQLNVSVSLLPPPVALEINELSYSHVFVSWAYQRKEYDQVTNSFQVKLREPGGDFVNTDSLKPIEKAYNVTDIKANTTYELFVLADTQYGIRESRSYRIITLDIPQITRIIVSVKYQELEYSSLLRNPDTQYYKRTSERVTDSIDFPLKGILGYVGNSVLNYRPGSVIADIVISVNQSGEAMDIKDFLAESVTSGYLGQLAVDSKYFEANIGGGYVVVESIDLHSENVYNGSDISISCAITTVGYQGNSRFQFWWTSNGTQIRPTSASRFSISSVSNTTFPELYTSVLTIRSVRPRDTGSYECYVTDAEEESTSSDRLTVEVVSQPIVSLSPRSLTVNSGDTVIVTCTLVAPFNKPVEFHWYRNGTLLELKEGEIYSSNDTSGTITITRMTATTIYGCLGRNDAGDGQRVQSHIGVIPAGPEITLCPELTDIRGRLWPSTLPGAVAVKKCPAKYTGEITRQCGGDGNWRSPKYSCVQTSITEIQQQVKDVKDGASSVRITDSLKGLHNVTDNEELYEGDITAVIDTLDDTAVVSSSGIDDPGDKDAQYEEVDVFLKVCSNLIDERNKASWETSIENDGVGAIEVTRVVEKYIKTKSEQLSATINASFEREFSQKNIYAKIGRETGKSLTFPNRGSTAPEWMQNSGSQIFIPEETIKDMSVIIYDGAYYRNLTNIVAKPLKRNGQIEDVSGTLDFNSDIIYFKLLGAQSVLEPPPIIKFKIYDTNYSDPVCAFWDFEENTWSTEGCYLETLIDDLVTCRCNHFTNFAVLMSPGKAPAADILALSIISAVGCAISMFCLVLTIVLHCMLWRIVKSDRAVLLINLCIALIIGYALFLGGVGQADKEDLCTAIAVLLHYIFLVVFFVMLAEGIEIAVSIMYVFATKSRIKWLVPLAWFIPAVIVAIAAGVTKLEGYGNETFCWLSTESGLLWAFVGPAAFVILVNFVIVVIVFRQMFTSSAMLTKSDKQKAKTSLRGLCVLLPIMGLTWVFGVFSVNEDLVAFQYIFAVCNSLQGFFIFLFHCLLNKQLQDALKQRRARKKSLQSFEKSYKNIHSSGTASTTYQSSEDKTKQINNEPAVKSTSNPFLEADRQMKELVGKGKKTGNTFDKESANKKDKVDKDKPPVDVALEDVKISNILRESEVMSGTAGISSILTAQSDTDVHTRREEVPSEANSNIRASKATTHAYDYILDSSYKSSGGIEKPAGYEKLLGPAAKTAGYDRIVRSDENVTALYIPGKDSVSQPRGRAEPRERVDDVRGRSTSSRSDEDYEQRLRERQERLQTVYMPYDRSVQVSQEEVGAALPKKYDPKQVKKTEIQVPKKGFISSKPKGAEAGAVKKLSAKKKKEMDRSKVYQYQYPYDATYLGQQSRHSSLENMTVHYVNPEYSPYAGMQPQGYTGRPTHQPRQWNPYGGWGNQQRRDYW